MISIPTLASISLPIPHLMCLHQPSIFILISPKYSTHFAISILLHLLLLILCMLSILLVLNHHFCSVPNNISLFSPSIQSSIYYLPFSFIISYCYDVDPIDLILHPQKASSPFQSSFTIVVILVVVVKSG